MMDIFLTIPQAAKLSQISESGLFQLIRIGKIKSVMTQFGDILVSKNDIQDQPTREMYSHLAGIGIGVREASERYGVPNPTISRWIRRGLITVIHRGDRGQKMLIDEADVAYRCAMYKLDPGQGKRTDKL